MALSEYIDGELHGPARLETQAHLNVCPSCGRTYRTMLRVLTLYKIYGNADLVPLSAQAREKQRQRTLD